MIIVISRPTADILVVFPRTIFMGAQSRFTIEAGTVSAGPAYNIDGWLLEGAVAGLTCTNAPCLIDVSDKDFAVADFASFGRVHNRFHNALDNVV